MMDIHTLSPYKPSLDIPSLVLARSDTELGGETIGEICHRRETQPLADLTDGHPVTTQHQCRLLQPVQTDILHGRKRHGAFHAAVKRTGTHWKRRVCLTPSGMRDCPLWAK